MPVNVHVPVNEHVHEHGPNAASPKSVIIRIVRLNHKPDSLSRISQISQLNRMTGRIRQLREANVKVQL